VTRVLRAARTLAWLLAALACNRESPEATSGAPPSATATVEAPGVVEEAIVADDACGELAAVLGCMHEKASPEERKGLALKRAETLAQMDALGDRADVACRRALEDAEDVLRRTGCAGGRDAWQSAELPSYAPRAARPLADDCRAPLLAIANAPRDQGLTYPWPWARQVVYAHEAFVVVATEPARRGEIQFEVIVTDRALTLVARCWDAATCNALAATYEAVVRSSQPLLFCGRVPIDGDRLAAFVAPEDGRWLPRADDWSGSCARIASCRIALDPDTPGDPGLECQQSPAKAILVCAGRARCGDVVACLASGP
jgi:hypothetical protein